jgi:hypothetical protein
MSDRPGRMAGKPMARIVAVILLCGVLVAAGLVLLAVRKPSHPTVDLSAIDDPAQINDYHLDLPDLEPMKWVRKYLPEEASPGYNLVLYRRRVPMLIDMNGRIVHVWPRVRGVGRVRLDREGRLAVIGTDNLIKQYDWEGNLLWYFRLPVEGDFPHHDLVELRNGNFLVLARDDTTHTGYLLEVDGRGRVVWEWRSLDHIDAFPTWDHGRKDPTHFNSIRELPPNRWFDAGDDRFRPGNILVSARHFNAIFIIEKASGKVVWHYAGELDYQHEAVMVEKGEQGAGLITVFNNGRHDRNGYRRSLVQAIDPLAREVVWEWGSKFFFSSVAGVAQTLPGGNIMITSSHGGRVFEITPEGKTVWEWVPPYMPMREERLPYDHCPQLIAIGSPEEIEVHPPYKGPYIDIDLYRFALTEDFETRTLAGFSRRLLRSHDACRELLIPPGASVWVEFGIDEERLQGRRLSARFRLSIAEKGRPAEGLLDRSLDTDSESPWRGRNIPLGRFGFKRVEMCVSTEAEGEMEDPLRVVAWGNPLIRSSVQHPEDQRVDKRVTEEERKLREQQLRALGYIN